MQFSRHTLMALPLLAGLVGLAGSVGCGAGAVRVTRLKPAEVNMAGVQKIAVMSFRGPDGDNLNGLVVDGLNESKRYEVLAAEDVLGSIMEEQNLALAEGRVDDKSGEVLGKLNVAQAVVSGTVTKAEHDQKVESKRETCSKSEKGADGKYHERKYPCTKNIRRGWAKYSARLSVASTVTRKLMDSKTLQDEAAVETSAYDEDPEEIDTEQLLAKCRATVAQQFLRRVAPYTVYEEVALEEHGDLPELEAGNKLIKHNDLPSAQERFVAAVAKAEADAEMKPKVKGRAYYSLGIVLALQGDFDGGLENLKKACDLQSNDDWMNMMGRVRTWKAEADKVAEQMAEASSDEE
ncbi:MAG: CsgG/HfaB family protein [Pseudomonadota bacterium]